MSISDPGRVPAAQAATRLNLGQLLCNASRQFPQQLIVHGERRFTYAEFGRRVHRLAAVLDALGVRAGETVAVLDWDSHRYLEAFLAVPMLGAVLHTVNVRLSPEQIAWTIEHAADDVILVHEDFLPLLDAIRPRLAHVRRFVLLCDHAGGEALGGLPFAGEYEALLAAAAGDFAFPEVAEDARATTFYTTGTTGLPKGVFFSHRQLVLHTLGVRSTLSGTGQGHIGADDVYMPITPMFHVHAWGMPLVALSMGLKQVYPGRYEPAKLLRLIVREGVSFSHCVPAILQMLLNCPDGREMDLDGWKVLIGGSALPESLAIAALERGIDVFGGYGMSETCPILCVAQLTPEVLRRPFAEQVRIRCKAGRAAPLVQLRIVDDEMNDVAHDGIAQGEVIARAPWLTEGYLHNPEAGAALWRGGWLHTGDIGTIDADGYLKITDRLKDVIKTGGEWVSTLMLEDLILRLHEVAECAVVGIPDPRWDERPLALVVLRGGASLDPAMIRAHLAGFVAEGLIPKYALPERIEQVEAIPKTSVGKLDKKAIRAQYAG